MFESQFGPVLCLVLLSLLTIKFPRLQFNLYMDLENGIARSVVS